jgi:hypothetical protein
MDFFNIVVGKDRLARVVGRWTNLDHQPERGEGLG